MMGRKNKNRQKKKTGEAEGAPQSTPVPPASKPKVVKEEKSEVNTYRKIKAVFQCTGGNCRKKWSSVHAWDEDIFCDFCYAKAEVGKCLDESLELANYYCCGQHWQSMLGSEAEARKEECYECGTSVAPAEGTQIRFGRHFWYICTGPTCGEEWEDFSLTPQRTQRCSKCKNAGNIIGVTKILKDETIGGGGGDGGGAGGGARGMGQHNWEYCDMCRDLKAQGLPGRCLRLRKVQCKVVPLDDGTYKEKIVSIK